MTDISDSANYLGVEWRLCIDQLDGGAVIGSAYSTFLTEAMPFRDIGLLVLRIDSILDFHNFPQAFLAMRSFGDTAEIPAYAAAPDAGISPETLAEAYGKTDTICIHIVSRRNATWQGRISFFDDCDPVFFQSTLELLRLLNTRLMPI